MCEGYKPGHPGLLSRDGFGLAPALTMVSWEPNAQSNSAQTTTKLSPMIR